MIDVDAIAMSIELAQQAQTVIIRPHIQLPPGLPAGLSYRLDVNQQSGGGQSSISQAGTLGDGNTQGAVTLQAQPGAHCTATLTLLQGTQALKSVSRTCS